MIEKDLLLFFPFVAAAALGRPLPPVSEGRLDDWYALSAFHRVETIFTYGLLESPVPLSTEKKEALYQKLAASALSDVRRTAVLEAACAALRAHGIDYMPLKGCLLSRMYRYPEMRQMADLDILVRFESPEAVEAAMQNAGFRFVLESNHEVVFEKDGISVELHKYLIPTYNEDFYAYYKTGWQLARQTDEPHCFSLDAADGLIYLFVHFAKHYRDAGVGVRPLLDLLLWQEKMKPDEAYIKGELEKLGLLTFGKKVQALLGAWLRGGAWDETLEEMAQYIVKSGSLGTEIGRILTDTLRPGAILTRRQKLFPSAAALQKKYPQLRKRGYLLPFYYIRRLFAAALRLPKIRQKEKHRRAFATEENVKRYAAHMEKVGLRVDRGKQDL